MRDMGHVCKCLMYFYTEMLFPLVALVEQKK